MLRQAAIAQVEHEQTIERDRLAEVQELDLLERVNTDDVPADVEAGETNGRNYAGTKLAKVVPLDKKKTSHKKGAMISSSLNAPTNLPTYLINPRSPFLARWDYAMIIALLFTASFTPFELAFLSNRTEETDWGLYFLNVFVNLIFIMDIVITLLTPYQENGMWVENFSRIAFHYLRGWLILDVVSCLPIDTITVLSAHFGDNHGGSKSPAAGSLVRLLKIAKIAKLLRMSRLGKILERFEEETAMSFSTRKIVGYVLMMLALAHWFACLDRLVIDFDDWPGSCIRNATTLRYCHPNWLEMYFDGITLQNGVRNYPCGAILKTSSCQSSGVCGNNAVLEEILDWDEGRDFCYGVFTEWQIAIYWSTMTITTIGYGDVGIVTTAERGVSIFNMLVGGFVYAYIVGAFCGTVASMDELTLKFQRSLDDLNRFMEDQGLEYELRVRVRHFFHYTEDMQKHRHYNNLLLQLSPDLRGEVALLASSGPLSHPSY